VATPDRFHPELAFEDRAHGEGLRIVNDNDVLGRHVSGEVIGVLLADPLEERTVLAGERPIAHAMNHVVHALGELEEGCAIGLQDRPLDVHAQLAQQRHHLREHLCHAAPLGSRVDHPDLATAERGHQRFGLAAKHSDGRRQKRQGGVVRQSNGLVGLNDPCHS
jgi:hypothetical protein